MNGTVPVVGFVGNGATLTFHNVTGGTTGGSKLVTVDYINADFTMSNTACSNCRNAYVSVNGGTAVQVQFPISAQVRIPLMAFGLWACRLRLLIWRAGSCRAGTSIIQGTSSSWMGS